MVCGTIRVHGRESCCLVLCRHCTSRTTSFDGTAKGVRLLRSALLNAGAHAEHRHRTRISFVHQQQNQRVLKMLAKKRKADRANQDKAMRGKNRKMEDADGAVCPFCCGVQIRFRPSGQRPCGKTDRTEPLNLQDGRPQLRTRREPTRPSDNQIIDRSGN